jgi:DNA-binding PadR family transcriptional regulator
VSLEHILLGMLREPASGYQLRRDFEQGARHFWSAELSQIYPTLARMEHRGWLESREQPSPVGPARRVYRRTAAGRRALIAWLKAEPVLGTERFAYIGQLIFLGELGDLEHTSSFLHKLRERLATTLAFLEQVAAPLAQQLATDSRSLSDSEFHEYLALRMGIVSLSAKVSSSDESLEMIRIRKRRRSPNA